MSFPRSYSTDCSSNLQFRSDIEASYQESDHDTVGSPIQSSRISSSPPHSPSQSPRSIRSPISPIMTANRDPLRVIHNSPKISKSIHPIHRNYKSHIQNYQPIPFPKNCSLDSERYSQNDVHPIPHNPEQSYVQHKYSRQNDHEEYNSLRSPSPDVQISPSRSNVQDAEARLPTLFAQLKARLGAPKRTAIVTSLSRRESRHSSYSSDTDETDGISPPSSHHDNSLSGYDSCFNSWSAFSPTLYGIPCSSAGLKSYSNHDLDIEECILRLQNDDAGRVEHRTIAFSTHLAISRWEPIPIPNAHMSTSPSEVKSETQDSNQNFGQRPPSPLKQQDQQQHRNDPVYAARLMSLANYIRHVISLSSGTSPIQSQLALYQEQQLKQQQKLQSCRKTSPTFTPQNHDASLPSPLSAGPGPIKSSTAISMRRHRYSSEYHDYQSRRQISQQSRNTQPNSPTNLKSLEFSMEGNQIYSPTSPTSIQFRVPFPNLTLTLALIYVDRLKAKNPDAKGEPGCSHRLFLVAYIIAAKYRCSVEIASLMRERDNITKYNESNDNHTPNTPRDRPSTWTPPTPVTPSISALNSIKSMNNDPNPELEAIEKKLQEARTNAEIIMSNHEWVRILSLASFFRPPLATPSNGSVTIARISPAQPLEQSDSNTRQSNEPKPLPIQSTPLDLKEETDARVISCDTKNISATIQSSDRTKVSTDNATAINTTSNTTNVNNNNNSTNTPMPTSMLQVEDLDRMETEFLTFLNFDLTARGQDLNTCWSLLIGNKEI